MEAVRTSVSSVEHHFSHSSLMLVAVRTSEEWVEYNFTHSWWWRQYAPLKRRSTIILHTHPWWWRQYAPLKRRSTVILHLIPDDGGSTHLWNVGRQSFYTAVQPRRQLWTPNILLGTLFSHTLNLCCPLNSRDQVSHPYKTSRWIMVLYILTFTLLDSRREDKRLNLMVASIPRI
jgi:hypothetical protein